jgi:anti-sigma-K factor RskA
MTSALHDDLRGALPDLALGTMDAPERARVQTHVDGCADCQAELAKLRTVLAGIGTATPATPPPALRERVLRHATSNPAVKAPLAPARPSAGGGWMPLALAASLLFGVLAAGYAWSVRAELESARRQAAEAADYVVRLRQELIAARRDAAELTRVMQILSSPSLVTAELKGQTAGSTAVGRAFWSATTGLFFSARGMAPLDAGRVYQLWEIRGTTAASAGTMTPDANGLVVHSAPGASGEPPDAFGVTVEPAGGSPTPTLPVIMLGRPN